MCKAKYMSLSWYMVGISEVRIYTWTDGATSGVY